jgi:hypothetical protein
MMPWVSPSAQKAQRSLKIMGMHCMAWKTPLLTNQMAHQCSDVVAMGALSQKTTRKMPKNGSRALNM